MKCWRQRCAFAAQDNISTPKIRNGRNAGAGRNNIRIADLQRKRASCVWLVPQRLSVTANCSDVSRSNIGFFQNRQRGITETLADPVIQVADHINSAVGRCSRRF